MNVHQIGSLLRYERENMKIGRGRLCEGLCTTPMLYKIEENQINTADKLLVDMLFQRLGKSPDKLEVIMSIEEYNKIRARDMMEELIWKKSFLRRSICWKNISHILMIKYIYSKCIIIEQKHI